MWDGKYNEAVYTLAKSTTDFAFLEGLSLVGLHGITVVASLAAVPIEYGIEKLWETAKEIAFQNQMKLYIAARKLGYSHEDILLGEDRYDKGILIFGESGKNRWICRVEDENGTVIKPPAVVVPDSTPQDVYGIALRVWEVLQNRQKFEEDKELIGKAFISWLHPKASFIAQPTSGFPPLTVHFNASGSKASKGATIESYHWIIEGPSLHEEFGPGLECIKIDLAT